MTSRIRRTVLPSGLRVISEQQAGVRSASIGVWVGVGSRDETPTLHGCSHFLEHLLFKGTTERTALDISVELDAVGGESNAVTGKEHTCYYARVLEEDLPMAVDVLCDMVTSARLDVADVESERGVILEELAMNDDDPGDVVHERFAEAVLGTHPLGRPIGGTPETINAVGRDNIVEHYHEHYQAPGLVVTVAGGVDHEQVCELVTASLARSGWAMPADGTPYSRRLIEGVTGDLAVASTGGAPSRLVVVNRPTEQANVVIGTTSLVATDPRRYSMSVLNAVLGGGMSSRLFQEIREKRGLAYSVYSFASGYSDSGYSDSGYFGLYAGCTPAKVDEVLRLLVSELRRLAADGVPEDELVRAHGQLSGGLVLGLEDTGSRMSRLGKAELVHGEYLGLDLALDRIRAVTAADVQSLAVDLSSRDLTLAVVGPFSPDRKFKLD